MKKFLNIKFLIAILLLIVFFWFGYFFIKGYFQEKSVNFSSSGNSPYKAQEAEKKEEIPKKISQKERNFSPKKSPDPERKEALSPKKKAPQGADFILISPNPVGIRFGYQITIQAYGFRFKDTKEKPPLNTDPLLPENQKSLQKKYISLGPVAVQWKNLSLNHPLPGRSCVFKVIPQKDPSKALVIPLSIAGELDPGIMAFLTTKPEIKNQGKVIISEWERVPKYVPQKPMKRKEIRIGKEAFFQLWGEEGGKIYGRVFMKEGADVVSRYKRVWDKKLLMEAFNLQSQEAFLQEIKSTLWKEVRPFMDYRFRLAIMRYESLEKGRSLNLGIEQYKITQYMKRQEIKVNRENVRPYTGPTLKEVERAMMQRDSVFLMKVIRLKHSYARDIFRTTRRDKDLRNLLVYQLRDFASQYPKPKQYEPFYSDLLYTLAMMGVATPEEEKLVMQYWRGHPPDWDKRYTWWR